MKKIVIWCNPYKKEFYYKIVKHRYLDYRVGMVNSYGHFIVLIIPNIKYLEFYPLEMEFKGIDWETFSLGNPGSNGN